MLIVWYKIIIFSQSSAEDTWNSLLANYHKFLQKYGYFRSDTENDQTIILPPKKTSKHSAAPVGCSFEKKFQKLHAKGPIISLNDQKTWGKFLHSRETS